MLISAMSEWTVNCYLNVFFSIIAYFLDERKTQFFSHVFDNQHLYLSLHVDNTEYILKN